MERIKKQVFIINGSGGCGKDTFVQFVANEISKLSNNKLIVGNYSSVDKVKEIARIIGWTEGKTEKDRKFLSDLKLLCAKYNDMPFKCMTNRYNTFKINNEIILFLHIREPEEIERAVKAFKAKTILIKRPDVAHITTNMADKNVFNYQYNYTINNDGNLGKFKNMAKLFADKYFRLLAISK